MDLTLLKIKYPRGRYYLRNRELLVFLVSYLFNKFYYKNENFKIKLIDFFLKFYKKNFGLTCSSCRMALYLIFSSLKLNQKDEILMTPITIPDMLNMVILQGLTPTFIDLNVKNHCIDIDSFVNKINYKTKVLLVTHISGISQDMELIKNICFQNKITLIEDVSQSHGATSSQNKKLGEFGDFTITSLTVGKSISTFVGGVLLTNNLEHFNNIKSECTSKNDNQYLKNKVIIRRIIESIKVSFLTNSLVFSYFTYLMIKFLSLIKIIDYDEIHLNKVGLNKVKNDLFLYDMPFRRKQLPSGLYTDINQWQAALGLFMVNTHQKKLDKRKENSLLFFTLIDDDVKKYLSLDLNLQTKHNYYHIPFYIENSGQLNEFKRFLLKSGVDIGGYSLSLCSELKEFSEFNCTLGGASKIHKNSVFIPIDETLSKKDIIKIAHIFNRGVLAIS